MNRRRIYIYSLWLATCVVLLSTVVLHHHHMESVCFVEERCADDGAVNDRHTGHEDNERGECSLGKIHRFVINSKTVSTVRRHIFDGSRGIARGVCACGSVARRRGSVAVGTVVWGVQRVAAVGQ